RKTAGDAIVWLAYPKGTSKKYKSQINRDNGWNALGREGFEPVRMVAIDQDWSALRFRRVEFIKNMRRPKEYRYTYRSIPITFLCSVPWCPLAHSTARRSYTPSRRCSARSSYPSAWPSPAMVLPQVLPAAALRELSFCQIHRTFLPAVHRGRRRSMASASAAA